MKRFPELLMKMSPCDTNIYDNNIRDIRDAIERGRDPCPMYEKCGRDPQAACAMRLGVDVAKYSLNSSLDAELDELRESGLLDDRLFITSDDRVEFRTVSGKEYVIQEIKRVAEHLLS